MSVARTDDSALDDDPDFMGQVILEGQGSEALPRKEVVYPLTKKMEHEGWIHLAGCHLVAATRSALSYFIASATTLPDPIFRPGNV